MWQAGRNPVFWCLPLLQHYCSGPAARGISSACRVSGILMHFYVCAFTCARSFTLLSVQGVLFKSKFLVFFFLECVHRVFCQIVLRSFLPSPFCRQTTFPVYYSALWKILVALFVRIVVLRVARVLARLSESLRFAVWLLLPQPTTACWQACFLLCPHWHLRHLGLQLMLQRLLQEHPLQFPMRSL